MSDRERLATTLGIMLAGLFEAEDAAAESERQPGRMSRHGSGVYPIGDALYASDMPPESSPAPDSVPAVAEDYPIAAEAIDPL